MKNKKIIESLDLCSAHGLQLDKQSHIQSFEHYMGLIQEWNKYSKLVSIKDAQEALPEHCADSISLGPTLATLLEQNDMEYWDLGTGGGFPAISLCILFPQLPTRLIERNTKKCTFLRKVCNRLGLDQVDIENRSFEASTGSSIPRIFTSRAIEKPELVIPEILRSLSVQDVYLCQSETINEVSPGILEKFHVEPLNDEFSTSGLRRNKLYLVKRTA